MLGAAAADELLGPCVVQTLQLCGCDGRLVQSPSTALRRSAHLSTVLGLSFLKFTSQNTVVQRAVAQAFECALIDSILLAWC